MDGVQTPGPLVKERDELEKRVRALEQQLREAKGSGRDGTGCRTSTVKCEHCGAPAMISDVNEVPLCYPCAVRLLTDDHLKLLRIINTRIGNRAVAEEERTPCNPDHDTYHWGWSDCAGMLRRSLAHAGFLWKIDAFTEAEEKDG